MVQTIDQQKNKNKIYIKNWLVIWRHCTDSMHTACCSKTMHRLDARRDKTRQPTIFVYFPFFVCSRLPLLLLLFILHILNSLSCSRILIFGITNFILFFFSTLSSLSRVCFFYTLHNFHESVFISCFKYDCEMRAFSFNTYALI